MTRRLFPSKPNQMLPILLPYEPVMHIKFAGKEPMKFNCENHDRLETKFYQTLFNHSCPLSEYQHDEDPICSTGFHILVSKPTRTADMILTGSNTVCNEEFHRSLLQPFAPPLPQLHINGSHDCNSVFYLMIQLEKLIWIPSSSHKFSHGNYNGQTFSNFKILCYSTEDRGLNSS